MIFQMASNKNSKVEEVGIHFKEIQMKTIVIVHQDLDQDHTLMVETVNPQDKDGLGLITTGPSHSLEVHQIFRTGLEWVSFKGNNPLVGEMPLVLATGEHLLTQITQINSRTLTLWHSHL